MNDEEYMNNRLNDQIDWYDGKSQRNQKWFKRLRFIEISSAAIIPFLAGMSDSCPYIPILIGVLGIIIAVSAGVGSVNKFQENWIFYRTTSETLKHEKFLYLTKCKPYDGDDAFQLLVQNTESIISKENSQWSRYIQKEEKEPAGQDEENNAPVSGPSS